MEKKPKPIKAKPQFYAICLQGMQEIAQDHGYNLIIHGSMNRDMDLVCIPWVDDPGPEVELVRELDEYLRGYSYEQTVAERGYHFSVLPGGRNSYVIHLNRGGRWNGHVDEQYYLDISFTPNNRQPTEAQIDAAWAHWARDNENTGTEVSWKKAIEWFRNFKDKKWL